jgi:hypothetical protein
VQEERIMRRLNRYRVVSFLAAVALVVLSLMDVPNAQGGAADEDRTVLALERDQNNIDPFFHFQRTGILINIDMCVGDRVREVLDLRVT